jgi:hypothetical protein
VGLATAQEVGALKAILPCVVVAALLGATCYFLFYA